MANTAWSMSVLGTRPDTLLSAFADEVVRRKCDFNEQNLSNILLAYATLDYPAPALFEALGAEIASRDDVNEQAISNSLWALAVSDTHSSAVKMLWRRACAYPVSQWIDDGLTQLSLVQLTLRCEKSDLADLPSEALQQAIDNVPLPTTISDTQQQVSKALRAIGWAHEEEQSVSGVVVDMLGTDGRIVQVDGPFHYTTCPLSGEVRENGNTKWNTRILRALGHNVVRVKYQDWYDAADAGNGKSFLRKLMEL